MTFGEKLKTEREKKGLTQTELGNATGVGQSAIAKFELGIRKPSIDTLVVIAKFFNVSTDYLIGNGQ